MSRDTHAEIVELTRALSELKRKIEAVHEQAVATRDALENDEPDKRLEVRPLNDVLEQLDEVWRRARMASYAAGHAYTLSGAYEDLLKARRG